MAEQLTQPSEIARETLRQLAMRRIPPTPDNYNTLYCEISGVQRKEDFPDKAMRQLVQALPRTTPEQTKFARAFEGAIADKSWDVLRQVLNDFVGKNAGEPLAWAVLIRDMIAQLDARSAGISPGKKRESLDLLLRASPPPDVLF